MQRRVERFGIAQMADDLAAVHIGLEEAEFHPVERRDQRARVDLGEQAVVHRRQRRQRQDLRATAEIGEHEARHVGSRRRSLARRSRADELEAGRRLARLRVADGYVGRDAGRQRLVETGVHHVQRHEDMPIEIGLERLARHPLDDVRGERGPPVRIGRRRAGGEDADRDVTLEVLAERQRILGVEIDDALGRLFEPAGVRHQLAHRHRAAVARRDLEVEIAVDVGVEVDLARLDLLHDRGPGEQLRHRARAEQRLLRIDRCSLVAIGVPEAAGRHDLPVGHHRDDGAGNVAAAQREGQVAVQPAVEIGLGERMLRGAGHRWRRGGLCRRDRRPRRRQARRDLCLHHAAEQDDAPQQLKQAHRHSPRRALDCPHQTWALQLTHNPFGTMLS